MQAQTSRSIEDTARELADAHRKADPLTTTVKLFPSPQNDEIRLVEISSSVPAINEVLPFRFNADYASDINYPSIVILLNPAEWNDIERGLLSLPAGWVLSTAKDI